MMGRNAKRPVKGRLSMHPGGEGDHSNRRSQRLSKDQLCLPSDSTAAPQFSLSLTGDCSIAAKMMGAVMG